MNEYFVRYKVKAKKPIYFGDFKSCDFVKIREIKEGVGSFIWESWINPVDFYEDIKYKISLLHQCETNEIDIITLNLVHQEYVT